MRRREFLTLLGGTAATWPIAARAQQPDRMRRIGVLTLSRNLRIDTRWAGADADAIRKYEAELVAGSCRKSVATMAQPAMSICRERGVPGRSHSPSFDHRRRPETFRTAMATAFFCPTNTTSFLPRVTPV